MTYSFFVTTCIFKYAKTGVWDYLNQFITFIYRPIQIWKSDDSDDSSEDGPQYSAIIQPPLIKQLRKILDEYPDGGQFLRFVYILQTCPSMTPHEQF